METKKYVWIVPEHLTGVRLDKALASFEPVHSRSQAEHLIKSHGVLVNSKSERASYKVKAGDQVDIVILSLESTALQPLAVPLNIVFEDQDLIVIEKPTGLVVHPAAGHAQDTLVNMLLHHDPEMAKGFPDHRPGIVHRLDKDTSGLMVVAKNIKTLDFLAAQFKARTVQRRYWALVFGKPKIEAGRIETHLARHPTSRKRFASTKNHKIGKRAVTHYKLQKNYTNGISWLECKLETGRTHQIRVHMLENHWPIIGDPKYGIKKIPQRLHTKTMMPLLRQCRLALHAFELGFKHPSGKDLHFQSPWPEDMHPLLKELGWL